jgi:hypothetical protein
MVVVLWLAVVAIASSPCSCWWRRSTASGPTAFLPAQGPAADASAGALDQGLLLKVMAAGAISQAAWWEATRIGFLATTSR